MKIKKSLSIEEAVQNLTGLCKHPYNNYYCGVTNNTERRKKEHNVASFVKIFNCPNRNTVLKLLSLLKEKGFNCVCDKQNGQDNSLKVYIYEIGKETKEELEATFKLTFGETGYKPDEEIPEEIGIYACFACSKIPKDDAYINPRLIYIGMTDKQNFKERINQHANLHHAKWARKHYYDSKNEQLVYALAECSSDVMQSIESALIFANQPIANEEEKDRYHGEYNRIVVYTQETTGKIKKVSKAHYE